MTCQKCGVDRPHFAKGLCKSCYNGEHKIAVPQSLADPALAQRFWSKVQRGGENVCWPWLHSTTKKGYGKFNFNGKGWMAHRLAWAIHHQREPRPEEAVCHQCDNPACCNPTHLWVGSRKDNLRDMVAKGRHGATRPRVLLLRLLEFTKSNGLEVPEPLWTDLQTYLHESSRWQGLKASASLGAPEGGGSEAPSSSKGPTKGEAKEGVAGTGSG